MRQLAWLHTAPTPPNSKRQSHKQPDQTPMTRLQKLHADNTAPDMPPSSPAHYLVGYLFDAGPYGAGGGGMGPSPLAWADIAQWQRATGTPLQAWESRTLRTLSAQYIATRQEAADPACPPPYLAAPDPKRRAAIDAKLRAAMAGRAARQPERGALVPRH